MQRIIIHMTSHRFGCEISVYYDYGQKRKKGADTEEPAGAAALGGFGKSTLLCMVLSRWDEPGYPSPTSALHSKLRHKNTYLHVCIGAANTNFQLNASVFIGTAERYKQ